MHEKNLTKKLLNYREAAEFLGIAHITLRRWVSEGRISHHKFGKAVRFSEEQLQSFLEKHEVTV